ncbi:hypothetical protein [Streptomyces chromofuscus]|uniref:Uncharacterized protein n=1 Tax=Streptomyces chromofuscus TaxID=42881 RepID=A0A7M2TDM3_STRCW|nr:hypothetical protein [Streptomyces chromofuscus]QOV46847.1 hypothetical protein IPT68_13730 [Streptomyces chromofuscus]
MLEKGQLNYLSSVQSDALIPAGKNVPAVPGTPRSVWLQTGYLIQHLP